MLLQMVPSYLTAMQFDDRDLPAGFMFRVPSCLRGLPLVSLHS